MLPARTFVILGLMSGIVVGHKALEDVIQFPGFIDQFMDDFLAGPVLFTIVLYIQRRFLIRTNNYKLPVSHTTALVLILVILFEGILPEISRHYTRDGFDILAYIAGAIFFHFILNQPGRANSTLLSD